MAYAPSNFDFFSLPAECLVKDWETQEANAILSINRIYGIMAALSGDLQVIDPMAAYDAVNASLRRFWDVHHSDLTIPLWTEEKCLKMARKYWKE
jgi:hypothetical protein